MRWLGNFELTWFQLVIFLPDLEFQILLSSLMVKHFTKEFFRLTMTAIPSRAIGSSTKSIPFFLHLVISSSLMGREAPTISISPAQNLLMPPPVPLEATLT